LNVLKQVYNFMALEDFRSVIMAVKAAQIVELYFLAGQSSVGLSFELKAATNQSLKLCALNLLEAYSMSDKVVRQCHAGSSDCFGDTGRSCF
jgi:GDPmannose 4,6-dehydratase